MARAARIEDVHRIATGMPHVVTLAGSKGLPIHQVGGKSFVYFRNARPDAFDPVTGERYDDVIVVWVASEDDKQALLSQQDAWLAQASRRRAERWLAERWLAEH